MYKSKKLMFLITETPMHAGSGSDLGIVDLPIQRERHTGFPKIEASSLKGAIRESFEGYSKKVEINGTETDVNKDENINLVFGPEEGDAHAGALGFTDARLLFFPVKSMKDVFVWITCPKVLKRFQKDMELIDGKSNSAEFKFDDNIKEGEFYGFENNSDILIGDGKLILEEYTFTKSKNAKKETVKRPEKFLKDIDIETNKIIVLHDNDFTDFVNLSTEVITRTKISNETGTVAKGQLWTEEYLPAETVMYSMVMASDIFNTEKGIFTNGADDVIKFFEAGLQPVVQIGGNATLGKGITRTCFVNS